MVTAARPTGDSGGRVGSLFLAAVIVFAVLASGPVAEKAVHEPLARCVATIASLLLSPVGRASATGSRLQLDDFRADIADACNGAVPMAIYLAAVLAFPARWRDRARGVVLGLPSIFALNLVRVASLMIAGAHWPNRVERLHIDLWQPLMMILTMALWVFWVERLVRRRSTGTVRLILRAGVTYAALYLAWIPVQPAFIRLASGVARGALRLAEHPRLITSLSAQGNVVLIGSSISERQPLASWNGADLHIFIVATLALILSAPARSALRRVQLLALALAIAPFLAAAVCALQVESVSDAHAASRLGITLHAPAELAFLRWGNRALIMFGMLLFPAFMFLLAYMSGTRDGSAGNRGHDARADPGRPAARIRGITRAVLPVGGAALVCTLLVGSGKAGPPDPRTRRELWEKVARLNPDSAPAHINLGVAHEDEGRLDAAADAYRTALRLQPSLVEARYNLGNVFASRGDYALAVRAYEETLERTPDHAAARKNLGLALLQLGRECEALPHFERVVASGSVAFSRDRQLQDDIGRLRIRCR